MLNVSQDVCTALTEQQEHKMQQEVLPMVADPAIILSVVIYIMAVKPTLKIAF